MINVKEFFTIILSDEFVLLDEKAKEKMKDINQMMDAKWELGYTGWQTQVVSTDEIEAIDEIFEKKNSSLREINNALEVKMKGLVQRLEEEMVIMMKANEIFNCLLDRSGVSRNQE
jgi:hypothetical protein